MEVQVLTQSTELPIDPDYVHNYLDFDDTQNDDEVDLINRLIKAATRAIEKKANICMLETKYRVTMDVGTDVLDGKTLYLPRMPHSQITKVTEVDSLGTETELTEDTDYIVFGTLKKQLSFSSVANIQTIDAQTSPCQYIIEYKAGYNITGTYKTESLPEDLKAAVAQQTAEWYNNRNDFNPLIITNSQTLMIINEYDWTGWL